MRDQYTAVIVSRSDNSAPPIVGIMGGITFHIRPEYTLEQACQVANWLNGKDGPLHAMKTREHDGWDPVNRRNWHAARQDGQRRGLAPIRDKE